jgi:hypothetical protein
MPPVDMGVRADELWDEEDRWREPIQARDAAPVHSPIPKKLMNGLHYIIRTGPS